VIADRTATNGVAGVMRLRSLRILEPKPRSILSQYDERQEEKVRTEPTMLGHQSICLTRVVSPPHLSALPGVHDWLRSPGAANSGRGGDWREHLGAAARQCRLAGNGQYAKGNKYAVVEAARS